MYREGGTGGGVHVGEDLCGYGQHGDAAARGLRGYHLLDGRPAGVARSVLDLHRHLLHHAHGTATPPVHNNGCHGPRMCATMVAMGLSCAET
eukprot:8759611-Pyramimonas_sp.AAC.1